MLDFYGVSFSEKPGTFTLLVQRIQQGVILIDVGPLVRWMLFAGENDIEAEQIDNIFAKISHNFNGPVGMLLFALGRYITEKANENKQ